MSETVHKVTESLEITKDNPITMEQTSINHDQVALDVKQSNDALEVNPAISCKDEFEVSHDEPVSGNAVDSSVVSEKFSSFDKVDSFNVVEKTFMTSKDVLAMKSTTKLEKIVEFNEEDILKIEQNLYNRDNFLYDRFLGISESSLSIDEESSISNDIKIVVEEVTKDLVRDMTNLDVDDRNNYDSLKADDNVIDKVLDNTPIIQNESLSDVSNTKVESVIATVPDSEKSEIELTSNDLQMRDTLIQFEKKNTNINEILESSATSVSTNSIVQPKDVIDRIHSCAWLKKQQSDEKMKSTSGKSAPILTPLPPKDTIDDTYIEGNQKKNSKEKSERPPKQKKFVPVDLTELQSKDSKEDKPTPPPTMWGKNKNSASTLFPDSKGIVIDVNANEEMEKNIAIAQSLDTYEKEEEKRKILGASGSKPNIHDDNDWDNDESGWGKIHANLPDNPADLAIPSTSHSLPIDKFGRVDGCTEKHLYMGKGARKKEQDVIKALSENKSQPQNKTQNSEAEKKNESQKNRDVRNKPPGFPMKTQELNANDLKDKDQMANKNQQERPIHGRARKVTDNNLSNQNQQSSGSIQKSMNQNQNYSQMSQNSNRTQENNQRNPNQGSVGQDRDRDRYQNQNYSQMSQNSNRTQENNQRNPNQGNVGQDRDRDRYQNMNRFSRDNARAVSKTQDTYNKQQNDVDKNRDTFNRGQDNFRTQDNYNSGNSSDRVQNSDRNHNDDRGRYSMQRNEGFNRNQDNLDKSHDNHSNFGRNHDNLNRNQNNFNRNNDCFNSKQANCGRSQENFRRDQNYSDQNLNSTCAHKNQDQYNRNQNSFNKVNDQQNRNQDRYNNQRSDNTNKNQMDENWDDDSSKSVQKPQMHAQMQSQKDVKAKNSLDQQRKQSLKDDVKAADKKTDLSKQSDPKKEKQNVNTNLSKQNVPQQELNSKSQNSRAIGASSELKQENKKSEPVQCNIQKSHSSVNASIPSKVSPQENLIVEQSLMNKYTTEPVNIQQKSNVLLDFIGNHNIQQALNANSRMYSSASTTSQSTKTQVSVSNTTNPTVILPQYISDNRVLQNIPSYVTCADQSSYPNSVLNPNAQSYKIADDCSTSSQLSSSLEYAVQSGPMDYSSVSNVTDQIAQVSELATNPQDIQSVSKIITTLSKQLATAQANLLALEVKLFKKGGIEPSKNQTQLPHYNESPSPVQKCPIQTNAQAQLPHFSTARTSVQIPQFSEVHTSIKNCNLHSNTQAQLSQFGTTHHQTVSEDQIHQLPAEYVNVNYVLPPPGFQNVVSKTSLAQQEVYELANSDNCASGDIPQLSNDQIQANNLERLLNAQSMQMYQQHQQAAAAAAHYQQFNMSGAAAAVNTLPRGTRIVGMSPVSDIRQVPTNQFYKQ